MKHLEYITGAGGGAIAGTLAAIALIHSPGPVPVLIAMLASSIMGGILPVVGLYSGVGALLGLLTSILLRSDAIAPWWPTFALSGSLLGVARLLLTRPRRGVIAHESYSCRDAAASQAEEFVEQRTGGNRIRRHWRDMAILSLFVGPAAAATVGIILGGPLHFASAFFWGCFVLGTVIGVGLFLGFVAGSLCGENRKNAKRDKNARRDITDFQGEQEQKDNSM